MGLLKKSYAKKWSLLEKRLLCLLKIVGQRVNKFSTVSNKITESGEQQRLFS